jgi:hypothetical protein
MNPIKLIFLALLLLPIHQLFGQQQKDQWEKWNYLVGEWVGENNGQPGNGDGKFSFQRELDGNIMVRKSHTVFPATSTNVAIVHDDLLMIYMEAPGSQEAIYFDNEGHTIKYKVSYKENSIILTSDISPNAPRFRYTYTILDPKTVNASFEMASPQAPEDFKLYLQGKASKVQ